MDETRLSTRHNAWDIAFSYSISRPCICNVLSFSSSIENRSLRWMTTSSFLINTHHLKSRSYFSILPLFLIISSFFSLCSSNLHRVSRVSIRPSRFAVPAFFLPFFLFFFLSFYPSHDKQCKQRHVIRVTRVPRSMYATSPSSCSFRALFVLFSPSLHTREKGKVLRRHRAGASEKCHSGIQSAKSTLRSGGHARARNKEKGRSALLACLTSSLSRILNPPPPRTNHSHFRVGCSFVLPIRAPRKIPYTPFVFLLFYFFIINRFYTTKKTRKPNTETLSSRVRTCVMRIIIVFLLFIFIFIYLYLYSYLYLYLYLYFAFVFIYIYTHTYIYICVCIYICIYVYCARVHARANTVHGFSSSSCSC